MIWTLSLLACAPTAESGDTAPDTQADTDGFEALAGLTFVQADSPGVAAYTFAAEDDIYIDYAAAPEEWVLDDGSALPAHKAFVDTSYEGIRTFHGTVDWSTPEGTTLGETERWVYTMVFNEDYTSIPSGTLESYDAEGTLTYVLTFGEDLSYTVYP